LLTRHYYAAGPASDPAVTLPKLLGSAGQVEPVLRQLENFGRADRLPYRIAETNSVYAGGRPGVSDTLGAALWGIGLMFQIASAGSTVARATRACASIRAGRSRRPPRCGFSREASKPQPD